MDSDELNRILGNDTPEPSFMQDKVGSEEAKPIDETTIFCDEPGCDASFSGTMARAQLGRHKSAKHGIKKEVQTKDVKKVEKSDSQIPTSASYLEELLEGFAIPNRKGILLALKDDSQNIDELREALKSVRVDKNTADYIVKKYAASVGKNVTDTGVAVVEPQISPLKATVGMLNDSLQVQLLQNMLQPKQEAKNPELEAIKSQMQTVLEQNRQLQTQLLENQRKQEIEQLKEQNKKLEEKVELQKKESDGQMGSVSSMVEKTFTSIMHELEKRDIEDKHTKEITALKEELRLFKPTTAAAEGIRELRGMAQDVGMGFGAMVDRGLKSQEPTDRAAAFSQLIAAGLSPDKAYNLVNTTKPVPDARVEYENLARVTEEMEREHAERVSSKAQPQPAQPAAEATKSTDYANHIVFAPD